MSTALDIIKGSLRKLGVIASGETLSSEESRDGLDALNSMLESWSTQKLTVPGVAIEEFSLIASQNAYTMGVGGDFDTAIPIHTEAIFVRQNNTDIPVKLINNLQWGALASKESDSNIPQYIYIDNNYPLKNIYVYPKPSEANTLIFHNHRQLGSFSAFTTEFSLAFGYKRAVIYNLAIELAPEYGKSISGEIQKIASESLSNIKRVNIKQETRKVDSALMGGNGYNWRTGE